MHSTKLAIITILIALSIGTNYAMIIFYNVKLMDLIVFIGGFCLGPVAGALIGIITWAVYGTLNPLGFSFPILFSTMFFESIYGITGGLVRRTLSPNEGIKLRSAGAMTYAFFGILGMISTFTYDLATNIIFGYVNDMNILFTIILGFFPFGLVHMISNAFFFGIGGIPSIRAVLKVTGGEESGIHEK